MENLAARDFIDQEIRRLVHKSLTTQDLNNFSNIETFRIKLKHAVDSFKSKDLELTADDGQYPSERFDQIFDQAVDELRDSTAQPSVEDYPGLDLNSLQPEESAAPIPPVDPNAAYVPETPQGQPAFAPQPDPVAPEIPVDHVPPIPPAPEWTPPPQQSYADPGPVPQQPAQQETAYTPPPATAPAPAPAPAAAKPRSNGLMGILKLVGIAAIAFIVGFGASSIAGISIPGLGSSAETEDPKMKQMLEQRVAFLNQVQKGLTEYSTKNGNYPTTNRKYANVEKLLGFMKSKGVSISVPKGLGKDLHRYVSDGKGYKFVNVGTGDCHLARKMYPAMVDQKRAYGPIDCFSYGVWTTSAANW